MYSALLRRVTDYLPDDYRLFVYLSNQFAAAARIIAQLYQSRWQVELFFKWVKGHRRIRHFYSTSEKAVQTQIWTAVCVCMLIALVRKELGVTHNLALTLPILRVSAFEKAPLHQLLAANDLMHS